MGYDHFNWSVERIPRLTVDSEVERGLINDREQINDREITAPTAETAVNETKLKVPNGS